MANYPENAEENRRDGDSEKYRCRPRVLIGSILPTAIVRLGSFASSTLVVSIKHELRARDLAPSEYYES